MWKKLLYLLRLYKDDRNLYELAGDLENPVEGQSTFIAIVLAKKCINLVGYELYDVMLKGIDSWHSDLENSKDPVSFALYWQTILKAYQRYIEPRNLSIEEKQTVLNALRVLPTVPPDLAADLLIADVTIGMKKQDVYELVRLVYGVKKKR